MCPWGCDNLGIRQTLFPAGYHWSAAFSLNRCNGRDAINQTDLHQFMKSLIYTKRSHPSANRLDIPILGLPGRLWCGTNLPGKLLSNFKCDRFHRLDGCDCPRTQIEIQTTLTGECGCNLFTLVV